MKANIKDLELQIDYLIGYTPQGLHWKQEHGARQSLLYSTLCDPSCPQEVVDKINRLLDTIYRLKTEKNAIIKSGMNNSVKKYLSEIARQGGNTTKKRYGKEHFAQLGKKGMAKRWAGHKKKTTEQGK